LFFFFFLAIDRIQDNIIDYYNLFHLFYLDNRVIVISPASIICFFCVARKL
jgi:hypothetical protein